MLDIDGRHWHKARVCGQGDLGASTKTIGKVGRPMLVSLRRASGEVPKYWKSGR